MAHPSTTPRNCEWQGIIIRVIYIFTKLDITCPFIPATLDVTDLQQFREWLSTDPKDYLGSPFHNGLKLFLWIVNDYYHLNDEHT